MGIAADLELKAVPKERCIEVCCQVGMHGTIPVATDCEGTSG